MLDEKDKIIFEHLLQDCRTPIKYLSKVTKLTEPTVLYRMHKLEKEGYISKYDAILNHNKIFKKTQFIFLQIDRVKEEQIVQKLKNNKEIASIISILHKYNYLILTNINNIDKFKPFLDKITITYKIYDSNQVDLFHSSIFDIPVKYKPKEIKKQIQTNKPLKLDEIDIKLIKILSDGGAKDSILELSRKTGIRYETVLYRFRRFKKENLFPLFVAQIGSKQFSIQSILVKLKIQNFNYGDVLSKIKSINKSNWIVQIDESTYFTLIFAQTFEEYKQILEQIWKRFDKNLIDLEVYNTKEWLLINRYNFDNIFKK